MDIKFNCTKHHNKNTCSNNRNTMIYSFTSNFDTRFKLYIYLNSLGLNLYFEAARCDDT